MVVGDMELRTELLVVGGGPGGYAAAFHAADLGLDVTMIDPRPQPGGVCLHTGCIPTKTYLNLAETIFSARQSADKGVHFDPPRLDLAGMRAWQQQVITTMADGLVQLAGGRGVQLFRGTVIFENSTSARILDGEISRVRFRRAIIATGSHPIDLPGGKFLPNRRIMSSTEALALADIPARLLIIGGGYVGLELGTVYAALGSEVDLVERGDRLLSEVDADLVQPLERRLATLFKRIDLGIRVTTLTEKDDEVTVDLAHGGGAVETRIVDRVLVAIGRQANTAELGLEHTGVVLTKEGFIGVNDQMQTADPHILAVGDVVGGIMLAHKASREGRVAAEVAAGRTTSCDLRAIPAVVYTDPQVAWCGLTEQQAARSDIAVTITKFPWKYSGRAQTMDATDGFTKLITQADSGRILGMGVVGRNAEDLIAEGVLAIEMGALAEDLALSLHPHPTLTETAAEAAELFLGSPIHMLPRKNITRKSK